MQCPLETGHHQQVLMRKDAAGFALTSKYPEAVHFRCLFLLQSINIMELTLQKYGSYEKFEQATGGSLLSKTRIWSHVRRYMVKEGCMGEVRSASPRGAGSGRFSSVSAAWLLLQVLFFQPRLAP